MLNVHQREAAEHLNGPLLVLAGAGSGKTRVLTQRVGNLVQHHQVSPSRILVVTFTNKAAKEMKERLIKLIGEEQVRRLWVGTFHAICSRILRENIELLGYDRRFVIYDPDDQKKTMRGVLEKLNLDPKQYPIPKQLSMVSRIKNGGAAPADGGFNLKANREKDIYEAYQTALKGNNALDFDDLLRLTTQLLQEQEDVLNRYQKWFQYILVDEYQDTNPVQFDMITLLAEQHQNVFVVGDVDQSIYSFRHADFRIILRFQQDYPNARTIKLEENYRSTHPIIAASNAVIAHNRERFEKTLISTQGEGEPLHYHEAYDGLAEAQQVLNQIRALRQSRQYGYGDMCVLYRTNAQSEPFERHLIKAGIPHIILGAFRFYERKEIKDMMAYLRVLFNPLDGINFQRILNTPKRGIGNKTIADLNELCQSNGLSMWEGLQHPMVMAQMGRGRKTLTEFGEWLNQTSQLAPSLSLPTLIDKIYRESGYEQEIRSEEEADKAEQREENVKVFVQSAREFDERRIKEGVPDEEALGAFLEHLSLISDVDSLKEEGGSVTLMTVHTAKGLEYPVVFVTGLEEGTFPHSRSIAEMDKNPLALEEERRLMYVAMTRAKKLLYLSHARQRTNYDGSKELKQPSRFFAEIPTQYLDKAPSNVIKRTSSTPSSGGLMTGREFYMNRFQEKPPVPAKPPGTVLKLHKGDQVKHAEWGYGRVEGISESGSKRIAIVAFTDKIGKRILDLGTAPLEKV